MTPRVLGAIGRKAAWLARGPWQDGRLLPPARGPADAERTGQTPEATDEGRTPHDAESAARCPPGGGAAAAPRTASGRTAPATRPGLGGR